MSERIIDIQAIALDDIIGASGDGIENVCIVSDIDEGTIRARVVNGQYDIRFDRDTGRAFADYGREAGYASISCVERLPQDIEIEVRALDAALGEGLRRDKEKEFNEKGGAAVIRKAIVHMDARRGVVASAAVVPGM